MGCRCYTRLRVGCQNVGTGLEGPAAERSLATHSLLPPPQIMEGVWGRLPNSVVVGDDGSERAMQFKRLTGKERSIRRWQAKRNKLVQKILDKDQRISREDALREANKRMGKMP